MGDLGKTMGWNRLTLPHLLALGDGVDACTHTHSGRRKERHCCFGKENLQEEEEERREGRWEQETGTLHCCLCRGRTSPTLRERALPPSRIIFSRAEKTPIFSVLWWCCVLSLQTWDSNWHTLAFPGKRKTHSGLPFMTHACLWHPERFKT